MKNGTMLHFCKSLYCLTQEEILTPVCASIIAILSHRASGGLFAHSKKYENEKENTKNENSLDYLKRGFPGSMLGITDLNQS